MAASISQTDIGANASNLTTYTFSSRSLGGAAADRYIAVAITTRSANARTIDSVTVGGVSAAEVVQVRNGSGGNSSIAAIFIAAVPTGTTGDVVVTHNLGVDYCGITVYRIIGSTGASPSSNSSISNNPSASINVPAGGVACAVAYTQANTSATWTNLTKDADFVTADTQSRCHTSAHGAFETEQSGLNVVCNFGSNSLVAFAVAAFEPAAATGVAGKMMHYRRLRI